MGEGAQKSEGTGSQQLKSSAQSTTVTPWGAFAACSAAFGLAVVAVSAFSYRRGLTRLRAEGISEEEAHKAFPYAAQAFGIATACVGGLGVSVVGAMYASGVDMQASAQVSSVQEALQTADQAGAWIGGKLQRFGERHLAPLVPEIRSASEMPQQKQQPESESATDARASTASGAA